MSGITSMKLYVRVAILRRRVLLRQLVRRTIAGALAVAALIVAAGLSTYALFLGIKAPLGDLGAAPSIAGLYLAVAIGLLLFTLHEPASPELDALAEMEAAALESATTDTQGIVHAFKTSATLSLSVSVPSRRFAGF